MAWNVPSTAVRQPDENQGRNDKGDKTLALEWKGPYDDLAEAGDALASGDEIIEGWVYSSHNVRRTPGNYGVLTVNCVPVCPTGGTQQNPTVEPLKDLWSIKSVRNDISIMAYCGPSEGQNPYRPHIEAWMKEPDGSVAAQYQFRRADGSLFQIPANTATMDLIGKIERGIEQVIRFYPIVTRERTYSQEPPKCLEHLGEVNAPEVPLTNAKMPGGLATAVADHEWLKVQDDAREQPDGKWTRTESWMGILKTTTTPHPWDSNLYGTGNDRWNMPHQK